MLEEIMGAFGFAAGGACIVCAKGLTSEDTGDGGVAFGVFETESVGVDVDVDMGVLPPLLLRALPVYFTGLSSQSFVPA